MPMIAIDSSGRLIQSDSARHDGKGFGRNASLVDESSVVVSNSRDLLNRQQWQADQDSIKANKAKIERENRKAKSARKENLDAFRRQQVAGPKVPAMTRDEQLIVGEIMRTMNGAADFDITRQVAAKTDFGSRADFQTYGITADQLKPNPYEGVITDFDKYVQGRSFTRPIEGKPRGMGDMFSDLLSTTDTSYFDTNPYADTVATSPTDPASVTVEQPATPSFWDNLWGGISSAATTYVQSPAAQQALQQQLAQATGQKSPTTTTTVVRTGTVVAAPATLITIPGTKIQVSKTVFYGGLLLAGVGVFMVMRRRK